MRTWMNILIGAIILVGCIAAGWIATNRVQNGVPIVPGLNGCSRLSTPSKQVSCLSDVFSEGADDAAGSTRGTERDRAVIEYVRRAERLASGNPRLADTCHPAMHALGRREGATAASESRTPTFPGGSSQLCTAGYVHGLAEGYIGRAAHVDAAGIFPDLCADVNARAGCAHGVGHALIRAEDTTAKPSQDKSLTSCETLPELYVSDCYNGVYMELTMVNGTGKLSPSQFAADCGKSANTDRELSCWSYLPLSLTMNDVPIEEFPSWCARSDLPGQFTCTEAYGRQLGPAKVASCATSGRRPELQQRCVEGAIGLSVGSGHVTRKEAASNCGTLKSTTLASYCERAVDRYASGRAKVEAETTM